MINFITPAFAADTAAGAQDPFVTLILPMVLVFAVFYFLVIRPQQRKLREHKSKIDAIRRGDRIITSGGIMGKIAHVRGDAFEVEIAPNTRISIVKTAISDVVNKSEPVALEDGKSG